MPTCLHVVPPPRAVARLFAPDPGWVGGWVGFGRIPPEDSKKNAGRRGPPPAPDGGDGRHLLRNAVRRGSPGRPTKGSWVRWGWGSLRAKLRTRGATLQQMPGRPGALVAGSCGYVCARKRPATWTQGLSAMAAGGWTPFPPPHPP